MQQSALIFSSLSLQQSLIVLLISSFIRLTLCISRSVFLILSLLILSSSSIAVCFIELQRGWDKIDWLNLCNYYLFQIQFHLKKLVSLSCSTFTIKVMIDSFVLLFFSFWRATFINEVFYWMIVKRLLFFFFIQLRIQVNSQTFQFVFIFFPLLL